MLPPGIYLHQMVHRLTGNKLVPEQQSFPPRPDDGPLIWCHTSGMGDLAALEDFIRQLSRVRDDLSYLITCPHGAKLAPVAADLDDIVLHHPLPDTSIKASQAFLDHWRPDLVVWMDCRFEVALLAETHQRKIPAIWVNARSPLADQPSLVWLRGTARGIASGFHSILAESRSSVVTLSKLGVPMRKVKEAGVLQRQTPPPSCNMAERDDMASVLGARPIWLALNTSAAEDTMAVEAHRQVMRKSHRLLLVLVPDVPERVPQLVEGLERDGWVVAVRSRDQDPTPEVQVYIADLPEEEGLWMHLSPITFMGHTLSGGECLSPNAAASLGSVVLFGINLDRHESAFARLEAAGAARKVDCRDHLAREVEYLLQPEHAAEMAMAAWDITTSGAETAGMIEELVLGLLDRQGG